MAGMVVVVVSVAVAVVVGKVVGHAVLALVVGVAAAVVAKPRVLATHSELGHHQLLRRSRTPAKMRRRHGDVVLHTDVRPQLSHAGATVKSDPGK